MIFGQEGDLKKLPILNDRVRRQPSGVYPKSAHVRVCHFLVILSLYMLWVIYVDFRFKRSILSCIPYYQTSNSL